MGKSFLIYHIHAKSLKKKAIKLIQLYYNEKFLKGKHHCIQKQVTNYEKYFSSHYRRKGKFLYYIKSLYKTLRKKTINAIEKNKFNRDFTSEDI